MNHHDHAYNKSSIGPFILGALSALVAGGYYFFFSKKAKRNRMKADLWVEDVKEEVIERARKVKDITSDKFDEIVETVIGKYEDAKDATKEKINKIKKEIRDEWESTKEESDEDE